MLMYILTQNNTIIAKKASQSFGEYEVLFVSLQRQNHKAVQSRRVISAFFLYPYLSN